MENTHQIEAPLLAQLADLGIEIAMHRHPPLHTVEESRALRGASGNLSFGSSELLEASLGVKAGSVTPFAVLNDDAGIVTMVLANTVLEQNPVNAHPLHNEATAAIARDDLLRFLKACDHPPLLIDLPAS